jgi:hypothetical protein
MYLRNVKHLLRGGVKGGGEVSANGPGFDERRYGFSGLIDLLRACQREGLVRLERDRRGGLRVFQGTALRPSAAPASIDVRPESQPIEVQPGELVDSEEPLETEHHEAEPVPVDTTAELLGRAKPKRPRVRSAAPAGPRAPRKNGPRKPAARRSSRRKSASAEAAADRKTE